MRARWAIALLGLLVVGAIAAELFVFRAKLSAGPLAVTTALLVFLILSFGLTVTLQVARAKVQSTPFAPLNTDEYKVNRTDARALPSRLVDLVWEVKRELALLSVRQGEMSSQPLGQAGAAFVEMAKSLASRSGGLPLPFAQDELVQGAVSGVIALIDARHERLVAEALYTVQSHGLWHFRYGRPDAGGNLRAAVAGDMPSLGYSYEVFRQAMARHKAVHDSEPFPSIDRRDFLDILYLRRDQLRRLANAYAEHGWDGFNKANKWDWPKEWQVDWNGSVGSSPADVERDLALTNAAIEYQFLRLSLTEGLEAERSR